jgi:hypothetical protein
MLYQRPTFTCPTATANTTQVQFDLAVLSKAEFMRKHGVSASEYEMLASGTKRKSPHVA